jgi:hypothetical protein
MNKHDNERELLEELIRKEEEDLQEVQGAIQKIEKEIERREKEGEESPALDPVE